MSFSIMTHSEKKLFFLIQSDDRSLFSDIYLNGDFVNRDIENSKNTSLLGEAVKRNALKIANFIIDHEPERMNKPDSSGNLPLSHLPLLDNKEDMIDLFERKGFDFSKGVGAKGNILHIVALDAEVGLFKSLVEKGARPTEVNNSKEKPQDIAKRWGNLVIDSYIEKNHTDNEPSSFDL
ncbi:hypothetical protein [Psychromonas sp. SP041]|uniref:hypothetical protein n=1 Tax=Psychromonas sp. SP041 TaxID=1365007 RepID=UPI0010C7B576|nr:hypothetical protein [Psychromonas sp. SP041]